jgi:cytochrome c553
MRRRVTVAAVLALVLSGCLGEGDSSDDVQRGEKLFAKAGCGDCHTLAAAGSRGTRGPNLDELRPEVSQVARQVLQGGAGMPSFSDRLSSDEIHQVAAYVSTAAAGGAAPPNAKFELTDTELPECSRDDATCLEQAFANLTYREGARPALDRLQREMDRDRFVRQQCHRIGHAMGGAGLARYEDPGRALAAGSTVCWSGYYHGVLEDGFYGTPDSEIAGKARELCSDRGLRQDLFLLYQCVHGLGHGLMIFTGYDLPKALDACDALTTPFDQQACIGGTFMENFTNFYQVKSKWLRDDDPIYPCNSVAEYRKAHCYQLVTMRILYETGYDWRATARTCHESEPQWVAMCFQSFGRDASGVAGRNQRRAIELCGLTGRYQPDCIYAVVKNIAFDDGGRLSRAVRFCRMTPARSRGRCFRGLGSTVAVVEPVPRKRTAMCARLAKTHEYVGECWLGLAEGAPPPSSSAARS